MKKVVLLALCLLGLVFAGWTQEVCNNATDDDGDGLVDLNDDDCDCQSLVDLSLIPNASFEDTLCCPEEEAMMGCAESWVQASTATTDYYNLCGFSELTFEGATPPELPLPGDPDGEGFIGMYNFLSGYREYAGACLPTPLLAGVTYSLRLHTAYGYGDEDEMELNLFGSPLCSDLPWSGTTCPEGFGSWEFLDSHIITYDMDGGWQQITLTFTPTTNMSAISFGGPCGELGETANSYFYFDELVLVENSVLGYIEETGGWCSEDLVLNAIIEDAGGSWQWYKEGVALIGETSSALLPVPYGEGTFSALYSYGEGCKLIEYTSPLLVEADFTHNNVCFGDIVSFENNSSPAIEELDSLRWFFGDATTSIAESPDHLYLTPDVFPAELVIYSNDASCNDTARADVTVFARPEPDFEVVGLGVTEEGDTWKACTNHVLNFNDLTTIDGPVSFASWTWTFGDGGSGSEQNPQYNYSTSGTFPVKLIVVAENGCVDSVEQEVELVSIRPEFSADTVCYNNETQFVNLSSTEGETTITEWEWTFGDEGDTLYTENPDYLYDKPGMFEVELIISNEMGCMDSITKAVFVSPIPDPNFYASANPTDYFHTDLELVIIYPDDESNYIWQMPGGKPFMAGNLHRVDVHYPEFQSENYDVTLIETSEFGCVDSVTHTIVVLADQMVYAPNAFTPNGDPFNQEWGVFVEGLTLDEFQLYVFNRWGEVVWETRNPTDTWDGTAPDGVLVQNGTYVWYIKARDLINDEIFEYNGFINVIR